MLQSHVVSNKLRYLSQPGGKLAAVVSVINNKSDKHIVGKGVSCWE